MSYRFTFDLSKISQALFRDIASFSEKEKINEKMAHIAHTLVQKFNIEKNTGLPINDSITIIEDLIHVGIKNSVSKERFLQTHKRALFLPHCCRRYMDSRCKALFDGATSSYCCQHCSEDCQVHQATRLAQQRGYDIYVIPGASCVRKIFQKNTYDGVVGVACTDELKLASTILEQHGIPAQGIPLIKNGCSETRFNFETLDKILETNGKGSIKNKNTTCEHIYPSRIL
ncbi:MAG: DUF116 domain-containing protein [Candidatus Thermoplasmatota archaeon]